MAGSPDPVLGSTLWTVAVAVAAAAVTVAATHLLHGRGYGPRTLAVLGIEVGVQRLVGR